MRQQPRSKHGRRRRLCIAALFLGVLATLLFRRRIAPAFAGSADSSRECLVPTAHAQYATRPWGSVSVVSPMNMSGVLASCSRRPVDFQILLRARHATCTEPATFDQFMCEAQCPVEEPELERTIGVLGLANHSYSWPIEHCVQGRALYLVWILQGEINFVACAADRPYASRTYSTVRTVFVTTLRVLHLLSCLVRLPDVVFLLDPSDFATPTAPSQVSEWSYMEPLPPTFRYVGTRAHAGILFPTDSFLVNSAFCSLRRHSPYAQSRAATCLGSSEATKSCGEASRRARPGQTRRGGTRSAWRL